MRIAKLVGSWNWLERGRTPSTPVRRAVANDCEGEEGIPLIQPGADAGRGTGPGRGRLYYGWSIVGALSITELISFGVLYYAFSALLKPMQADLGWSLTVLSGGFSAALLVSGLAAPLVGHWLDRHGARLLMTAGSVVATGAVLAWSRVETIPGYFAVWLVIGLAMAAVFYDPAFAVITTWFIRLRGRALLAMTISGGLASTIFLPLTDFLSRSLGWREALVVLAIILGVGTIAPHLLVLRRRPEDLGLLPDRESSAGTAQPHAASAVGSMPGDPRRSPDIDVRSAMRVPAFWWLVGAFVFSTLTTTAVTVHLVAYLTEQGHASDFAALIAGAYGLFSVTGRILITGAGRFISSGRMTVIVFGLQALAIAILVAWGSGTVGVLLFVVLFGASTGALTLARATVVADYFGRQSYGAISGTISLFSTLSRAAAPVGAGIGYGLASGYGPVFVCLTGTAVVATVAMAMAERTRRRANVAPTYASST